MNLPSTFLPTRGSYNSMKGSGKGQSAKLATKPAARKTSDGRKVSDKGNARSAVDVPSCEKCGVIVSQEVRALNCDKCGSVWNCAQCMDMTADAYDTLVELSGTASGSSLRWFCGACEHHIFEPATPAQPVEGSMDEIKLLLQALMDKFDSIDSKLKEKADVDEMRRLEERVEKLEQSVVKLEKSAGGEKKEATSTETGHGKSLVETSVNELKERDRRRENIIVFNIPESSCEDSDDRKKQDVERVLSVLETELKIKASVSSPTRLGRRNDNGKPRPLRLKVESEMAKNEILKVAKNLAIAKEDDTRKIYISRDMTPLEREQDKELRKELAEKRKEALDKGEQGRWIIRRGRVMKEKAIVN